MLSARPEELQGQKGATWPDGEKAPGRPAHRAPWRSCSLGPLRAPGL